MKKKIATFMFGLLLAVGWTSDASAQELRTESFSHELISAAVSPKPILSEAREFRGAHTHATSTSQRPPLKATPTSLKAIKHAAQITEGDVSKMVGGRKHAPKRAGQDTDMKSISKADADLITYQWDNGDGQGLRPSKATDVAKDPYQMYELLREVYTNPSFPGPYYSAYTKDDQRERKVYYGAIEGGWNITGDVLPSAGPTTQTITNAITVSDGTSTSTGYQYLPVYGYYFETVQKNQMIYSASMLGLQNGDQITSITFYPSNGITFHEGNVKLSLANTTTSSFTSATALNVTTTQVAATGKITANANQTEWTITFNQPFTYTGNNLLVQIDTEAGTYGSSSCGFYGTQQSNYVSYYSYSGGNTKNRSYFLPKAKFDYQRTITIDPTSYIGDINITASSYNVMFRDITVYDENNNVITSWNYNASYYTFTQGENTFTAYNLPTGWDANGLYMFRYSMTPSGSTNTYYYGYLSSENPGTLTIPHYLLAGHSSVRLVITALDADTGPTITVNGGTPVTVSSEYYTGATYEWTFNTQSHPYTEYDPDYYLPTEEGYTALIVCMKNEINHDFWNYYEEAYDNGYFDTKEQIVEFFRNNVDSIKLLTDGLRIGEASDYSIGTVFNCEGTYNKFFFLGKGQARQKPDVVREREVFNEHLVGEYVPFRYMFEQFSPTTGMQGDETTDFYSKMNEGNVYPVVHDCRSVIALEHEFSMSGNSGTTAYAMTGMNFFIPDYRLKYWEDTYNLTNTQSYTIDGRVINPYQSASTDGSPALNMSLLFRNPGNIAAWYANYNQQYAPKVGLYKITLDATATQVAQNYAPGNRNYAVTLTWVSSLNEMAGHKVPQTFTVYYWDPVTGERKYLVVEGVTTTNGETGETTLTYYVEQLEHSYTIDYIIYGRPNASSHSMFVAWSNIDGVIIPGWNDFVGLDLDHHESDFVAGDMANWYRNFLVVKNEDLYNGLTVAAVTGYNADDPSTPLTPMNTFNLYRWAIKDDVPQGEEKVATLTFDRGDATQMHYKVKYEDNQDIETYNVKNSQGQLILPANSYQRDKLGIPDSGWVRIKGNGDLVIWPNGYHVNFKSITVKNNGTVVTSWNSSQATLPSGWIVSPGSKWEEYTTSTVADNVGYMEGGGYIAIPNMLNNPDYTNLSVEIEAYGDGSGVTRIAVNDDSRQIANAAGTTYTWTNLSPNAKKSPKREIVTETVTVNENGTATNEYLPLLGYYYDYRQQWTQMIYTADQLGLSVGDVIKSITFYPTTQTLNLTGGKINVYMASTTQSNYDAGFSPITVDYNTALVASFVPAGNIDCTNGWTITFDTPYTYTGGNIVIDIDTEMGTTYTNDGDGFYGAETSSYMGFWARYEDSSWGGSRQYFQPKATFTYETESGDNPDDPGTLDPTDAGLLRLHLLMVDQFKEPIPDDNKHPDGYGYVLRYEPEQGEAKQSGTVDFEIEKTKAKVNGYYTQAEIDADTDASLELNVLTAQVQMDLKSDNPDILYFQMQGKKDATPEQNEDYLTKLQYMKNISMYEEMEETSPEKGHRYDPAETHFYYDDSTPIVTGSYSDNNFMSYAPSVSTWGIDRRYFETDAVDNTYGAPIWKTGVGNVTVINSEAQRQTLANGNDNPSVTWKVGDDTYCLYFLSVTAIGDLPKPSVSNIEYEPYMFRVFVRSAGGNLRNYIENPGDGVNTGAHLEDGGAITGPLCVGSYRWDNTDFTKAISPTDWDGNMKFGALKNIPDLEVFVRFYYMVKGWNTTRGEARPGNGAESGGFPPSPITGIYEMTVNGEIVGQTFYNAQGMMSDQPFDGVNIVVTRYSDGTTRTTKVVR